ncbi:MAG: aminotransferase class V-fold PLP-dependent enzyme [Acidimicrobiia bacterium]|nr:aminotransferase class V-fold PLP-dependent enzyme [Acidimicrobiia bacterium]
MQWQLEPSIRHLNHGAFGAVPSIVADHQSAIRAEIARNPTRFFAREIEGRLDAARQDLAVFLGSDADALAWINNTTTGVNLVLRHIERQLGPGDEVLITSHEYNACRNATEAMAARVGATVRRAELPFPVADAAAVAEAVLSNVTDSTRLVVLDHVTSQSAVVLPIERLVGQIEGSGIPTLVDGAHAPGMLELDLDSLGASFYVGNCHKWLCAPHGAAFLRVAERHRDTIDPLVISHGWNDTRPERNRYRKLFDWIGTDDPSAVLSVPSAIEAVGAALPGGWPAVMRRNHALALEGRRIVLDRIGGERAVPDDMIGTMAAIELPPAERPSEGIIDPLTGAIRESHRIEVPVFAFPESPRRVVRLSAQLYNTQDDYVALAGALAHHL